MSQSLAILGGQPVRTRAFTSWPIFGEPEEQRLLRTLRSGKWGKLHGPEVAEFEQRFAAMHGAKHGIGGGQRHRLAAHRPDGRWH